MQIESIPQQQKIELFRTGIATNRQAHRNSALDCLRKLSPDQADEQLVRLLKNAPKTPKTKYWFDQDALLGRLVADSKAPEVWEALHALLDRADLGMRMELIYNLLPPQDAPDEVLQSFFNVYYRFREDKTVREVSTSEKFSGPGAGFPRRRIET